MLWRDLTMIRIDKIHLDQPIHGCAVEQAQDLRNDDGGRARATSGMRSFRAPWTGPCALSIAKPGITTPVPAGNVRCRMCGARGGRRLPAGRANGRLAMPMSGWPTDMTIIPRQIRQLVTLMHENGLATVELRTERSALRLSFGKSSGAPHADARAAGQGPLVEVKSPAAGVFLRRHPNRDADFLAPNANADHGSLVGLIQVGTVLLPVLAPVAGRLAAYLVPDRATIAVATPLARLSPMRHRTTQE